MAGGQEAKCLYLNLNSYSLGRVFMFLKYKIGHLSQHVYERMNHVNSLNWLNCKARALNFSFLETWYQSDI